MVFSYKKNLCSLGYFFENMFLVFTLGISYFK